MTVRVLILMGSESDLGAMRAAADVLDEIGVGYEIGVASAHRTPERLVKIVREAPAKGIRVFIAGAGGAHHLGGVIASHTTLPVIAVPLAVGSFAGLDALLSAVQMPGGVPVASVGVGGARNAGLFAAAILAVSDRKIATALDAYRTRQVGKVEEADARVRDAFRKRRDGRG